MASVRNAFGFPAVVNEKAARVVAGGVVLITATALLTGWLWLSAVLAIGFALRVAAGPRYSPLGQLATKVVAPRLGEPKLVAGPPKRFAQAVGLVFTLFALAGFGLPTSAVTAVATAAALAAAFLNTAFGVCLGCEVYLVLRRITSSSPITRTVANDRFTHPRKASA
jgi:hypothetical protein